MLCVFGAEKSFLLLLLLKLIFVPFFFIGALNIFSLVFPKLWETIVKVSKSVCEFFFPEKKRSFLLDTFVFSSSWKADLQKKNPKNIQ